MAAEKRKGGGESKNQSKSKKPRSIASSSKSRRKSTPGDRAKSSMEKPRVSKKAPSNSKLVRADVSTVNKDVVLTKKNRRVVAKELAEARKKKRKVHYTLQQELASLWEKMRRRNIVKDERSKLVSEALKKMSGKMAEIASSHVSSRVLQTCIKYSSQAEKEAIFVELQPQLLTLTCNVYGVHLVKKMLDNATKKQLSGFISSLHGKVASLLRHMVGSVVIEHAFQLGNASQKQSLLSELYSPELQLFRDLTLNNGGRLRDIIPKLGLQKTSVLQHMTSVIQPILEKGIIDHSIIHTLLVEYLSIADKSSAEDVIQQLSGSLFVRMIHTKDGSKLGILCIKHGDAKERKKILKGIKEHVGKIALDQYGSLVVTCILTVVDDTKLLTKIIIRELQKILKDLVFDKNGRRSLLQLLHPQCPRYLSPDDLEALSSSLSSLCSKGKEAKIVDPNSAENLENDSEDDIHLTDIGGKKDDALRRYQLLVDSGLAESLIDVCIDFADELIRSHFGKEVIYEVVVGGIDKFFEQKYEEKMNNLRETIASLGALPRTTENKAHVFEDFHSSRTIRKLILDCPNFAMCLWEAALKGRAATWAQGHSAKVVSAFLESTDAKVRELTRTELQGLVDSGALKISKVNACKADED